MKRQLYVTTKEFESGRHLIGILTEECQETNSYSFEYKTNGTVPKWYMLLDEFPDVNKKYNGSDVQKLLDRFVPNRDDMYLSLFLERMGTTMYDVWNFLVFYGQSDPRRKAFLYVTLPEGVITYESV